MSNNKEVNTEPTFDYLDKRKTELVQEIDRLEKLLENKKKELNSHVFVCNMIMKEEVMP